MTGFWDAINNFTPPAVAEREYRVYYNSDGTIRFYTTEAIDDNSLFLAITHAEYEVGRYDLRVKDGKLKEIAVGSRKLVLSAEGTITHPDDITIIATTGVAWAVKEFLVDEE